MRYAFRPAAVSIRPMRVYFALCVRRGSSRMISKSLSTSSINNTHGANESAWWNAAIRCSVHFQWNGLPTLSPEHVASKPFSDTPNPYGMRRRNTGSYEPCNTNNGENHCILAKYVTRWVRWTRADQGELDRAGLPLAAAPMTATASSPRSFAFMMCSQSKMVPGAG